jgi:IS5 family transposase
MKKVSAAVGKVGTQMRDRMRSVKRRILEIARASRDISEKGKEKRVAAYGKLLEITSRVVGQAKKFSAEIAGKVKRGPRKILQKAKRQLDEMIPRVQQVIRQTRQRVLRGETRAEGKIVSVFEPQTEVIRKGKAGKPNEFGNLVKIQEAENQIVTHYEVFEERPSDSALLTPSIERHIEQFGHAPEMAAADAGFFSAANEAKAEELGVRRVAVPSQSSKSPQRKQRQKKRWFKKSPEMAHRLRRSYQRPQTPPWHPAQSLQGYRRYATLCRAQRDRRQPDQYRKNDGQVVGTFELSSHGPDGLRRGLSASRFWRRKLAYFHKTEF